MSEAHSTLPPILEWALWYASQGFSIIPTAPGEKRPGVEWTPYQHTRPTPEQITAWLTGLYQHSGIGLVTGTISGNIFVLDADVSDGKQGPENLDDLLMMNDDLPISWEARSGGGGRHHFLRAPPGVRIKNSKNELAQHVDVRGEGGFLILPPSPHPSGTFYKWIPGVDPATTPIADAPAWLVELCRDRSEDTGFDFTSNETQKSYVSLAGNLNAFGLHVDGREEYMRDLLWARLIEERRECAFPLTQDVLESVLQDCWMVFERKTKARHGSLQADGRGIDEMRRKLKYAARKWDTRIAVEARKPKQAKEWQEMERDEVTKTVIPHPRATIITTVDFHTLLTEVVEEEPDYIEQDFAGPGGFVLIAGPPKAQKSFLLQEGLVACATGGKFLADVFNVPRPLKVFYLQAEMNRKLLRKRARVFNLLSADQKTLLKTNLISSERFHMVLDESGAKIAIETIKGAFPNAPPDIIAVDPLANVFDGENENDNTQLMKFLAGRIEIIRQKINPLACVMMVHHSTKKTVEDMARDPFVAIRGGGALRGYYDSAIVLYKKSEEGRVRRAHFELRGGESPEPVDIELIDGRFQRIDSGSLPSRETCRLILARIDLEWKRGMPWSPHERSRSEGRYAVRNIVSEFEMTAESASLLLDLWMKEGVLTFRERVYRRHPSGYEVTGKID